jgi:hypothetical protein
MAADPSAGSPIRLLFVGQATRGQFYDSPRCNPAFSEAAERSEQILRSFIASPRTPFWGMTCNIAKRALHLIGSKPEWNERLSDVISWTNLVKIGTSVGNRPPGAKLRGDQSEICVRLLRSELRRQKSTAVILMTGNYAGTQILDPALTPGKWKEKLFLLEGKCFVWEYENLDSRSPTVISTFHPNYCRRAGTEQKVTEFIARYIAKPFRTKIRARNREFAKPSVSPTRVSVL